MNRAWVWFVVMCVLSCTDVSPTEEGGVLPLSEDGGAGRVTVGDGEGSVDSRVLQTDTGEGGSVPSDTTEPQDSVASSQDTGTTDAIEGPEEPDAGDGGSGSQSFTFDPTTFEYAVGCDFPLSGYVGGSIVFEPAFPNLPLYYPVAMMPAGDGTGRLYIVEQGGRIRRIPNIDQVAAADMVLDISDAITGLEGEGGLLGLAFDPNFQENRYLYVNYTTGSGWSESFRNVISRFRMNEGDGELVDPGSETLVMNVDQPYWNHNGGWLSFGPDGYLYIGTGDGGGAGDPLKSGQDTTTLLGAMLRVDVSTLDSTGTYSIPGDNPFAGGVGGNLPEIYAWGLRNPWRYDFDPIGGTLYAADVGQDKWEEINVITRGGNYGWNEMEGAHCYPSWSTCEEEAFVSPVAEYSHGLGLSVTGGYVYRGEKVPSLYGSYVYSDYVTFAAFAYPAPPGAGESGMIGSTPGPVAGFGIDAEGEIYALDHMESKIYRMAEAPPAGEPAVLPETLSATGCFSSLETMEPITGVVPYVVNNPLWSDGAEKNRFFALPPGGVIEPQEDGTLGYPTGTRFIKHFEMPLPSGENMRLETRFLVMTDEGLQGFTYRWNEAGTDAFLMKGAAEIGLGGDGSSVPEKWDIPTRNQCKVCHTDASDGLLSVDEVGQLSDVAGLGQLSAWQEAGILEEALPQQLPYHPGLGDEASLEERARAYLHTNCAGCHLPGGPPGARHMDLRFSTDLPQTGSCLVEPQKSTMGVEGAQIIAPGAAELSVLVLRMETEDSDLRMPPLGSELVHEGGAGVVREWIESLESCTP